MPKVFLRATQAKKTAQIKLIRLMSGEDVEVDNWEELAWINEILQYPSNLLLASLVTYVREEPGKEPVCYGVKEIKICIEQDIECRPEPPAELETACVKTTPPG